MTMQKQDSRLLALPREILNLIFLYFTPREIALFSEVCHVFYARGNDDLLWEKQLTLDFLARKEAFHITPIFEIAAKKGKQHLLTHVTQPLLFNS